MEQIELNYPDHESAEKAGLFAKGWIPLGIVCESMTNIHLISNPDQNSCIFNYDLDHEDFNRLRAEIKPSKHRSVRSGGIKIPSDWRKNVEALEHFSYTDPKDPDTVYLALDEKNQRIYGWRE